MGIICFTEDRQMAKYEFENSMFQNDAPIKRRKTSDDYSLTEKYKSILNDELFPESIQITGGPQFRYTQQPEFPVCHKTDTSFYSFTGEHQFNQEDNDDDFYFTAADMAHKKNLQNQKKSYHKRSKARTDSNMGEALLESSKMAEFKDIQNENPEEKENQWENAHNKENLKIYKKLVEGSPSICVRAKALIQNTKIELLFDHFYQDKHRIKWDKMMKEIRVVEKINDYKDIFYYKIDAGFAVSNRDWVIKRVVIKDKDELNQVKRIKMICYDTQHENEKEYKGVVRASCVMQGYELKQIDDDVQLELISNVDIKGSVPKFLVNKFADGGTKDWIENLVKYNKNNQQ